jgi:uncharacterized protein YndB with AHSA1/START domain
MDNHLKFKTTIEINAPATEVWQALTDPAIVKEYFFGTDLETSWEKGSPIIWRGEWQGKEYIEKGEVLDIDEGTSVSMSYLSTGLEDKPENYSFITYELEQTDPDFTALTLTQTGFKDQQACDHSKENWESVLDGLRRVVEEETNDELR